MRCKRNVRSHNLTLFIIPDPLSVLQVLVLLVVVSEPLDSKQDFPLEDDKGDEAAVVSSHVNETPLQARYTSICNENATS